MGDRRGNSSNVTMMRSEKHLFHRKPSDSSYSRSRGHPQTASYLHRFEESDARDFMYDMKKRRHREMDMESSQRKRARTQGDFYREAISKSVTEKEKRMEILQERWRKQRRLANGSRAKQEVKKVSMKRQRDKSQPLHIEKQKKSNEKAILDQIRPHGALPAHLKVKPSTKFKKVPIKVSEPPPKSTTVKPPSITAMNSPPKKTFHSPQKVVEPPPKVFRCSLKPFQNPPLKKRTPPLSSLLPPSPNAIQPPLVKEFLKSPSPKASAQKPQTPLPQTAPPSLKKTKALRIHITIPLHLRTIKPDIEILYCPTTPPFVTESPIISPISIPGNADESNNIHTNSISVQESLFSSDDDDDDSQTNDPPIRHDLSFIPKSIPSPLKIPRDIIQEVLQVPTSPMETEWDDSLPTVRPLTPPITNISTPQVPTSPMETEWDDSEPTVRPLTPPITIISTPPDDQYSSESSDDEDDFSDSESDASKSLGESDCNYSDQSESDSSSCSSSSSCDETDEDLRWMERNRKHTKKPKPFFHRAKQQQQQQQQQEQSRKKISKHVTPTPPSSSSSNHWVRRSVRQPCKWALKMPDLQLLLFNLKHNDRDMVVLKLKKYMGPDSPVLVMDAVLTALAENTNCQALYIQNFNQGMHDAQLLHLLQILQNHPKIWCLNIGETYNVKAKTWKKFARGLRKTRVTHIYASEHTISADLKVTMRNAVRDNRRKHGDHIDPDNVDVIIQCTHCWWNPINAKTLRPYLREAGHEHLLFDREVQGLPTPEELDKFRKAGGFI